MKKILLLTVLAGSLCFVANAMTEMLVEMQDGTIVRYDVNTLKQVTHKIESESSGKSVCVEMKDGTVECVESENIKQVFWERTPEDSVDGPFTVAFYVGIAFDSTLLSIQEVENGESAVEPSVPQKVGYEFSGWSDSSFVNVKGDVVAYARYKLKETSSKTVNGLTYSGQEDDYSYVDLGLASGLMWATCNVGTDNPCEHGYYIAWGETSRKSLYTRKSYKWADDDDMTYLIKYCTNSEWGDVDGLNTLLPQDDAATVLMGEKWRMPTYQEQQELIDGCEWKWTSVRGQAGCMGTSLTNGNTIFFPAVGQMASTYDNQTYVNQNGTYCFYWSSSILDDDPWNAIYLIAKENSIYLTTRDRIMGCPIRAVGR